MSDETAVQLTLDEQLIADTYEDDEANNETDDNQETESNSA